MTLVTHLCFRAFRVIFQRLAGSDSRAATVARLGETCGQARAERNSKEMTFQHFAGAAYRALTSPKDGPSLYDLCDPLLLNAPAAAIRILRNSTRRRLAIRRCARCCGARACRNCASRPGSRRCGSALTHARDDEAPDWAAIGQPVAELLDTIRLRHPKPKPVPAPAQAPELADTRKNHPHLRRASAALVRQPTVLFRPMRPST